MAEKEDAPLIDLNEASIKKLISKAKKRGYIAKLFFLPCGGVGAIFVIVQPCLTQQRQV